MILVVMVISFAVMITLSFFELGDVPFTTATNQTNQTNQTNPHSEVEAPSNAVIHISTSLSNECRPISECSEVETDELENQILTNQSNATESLIVNASEDRQPIFVPIAKNQTVEYTIKQLDVQENSVFKPRYNISTAYSTDCSGIVKAAETKECIISSSLEDRDSPKGRLHVITVIENDCAPSQFNYCGICLTKNLCTNFRADDLFSNHISTLHQNILKEVFNFPASEAGWIIEVFPDHTSDLVQYDVKQSIDNTQRILSARSLNITYSDECHGMLPDDGETKKCEIVNHTLLP
jgi:hypothetical protein